MVKRIMLALALLAAPAAASVYPIGIGGTNQNTFTLDGVIWFDGTRLTSGTNFTFINASTRLELTADGATYRLNNSSLNADCSYALTSDRYQCSAQVTKTAPSHAMEPVSPAGANVSYCATSGTSIGDTNEGAWVVVTRPTANAVGSYVVSKGADAEWAFTFTPSGTHANFSFWYGNTNHNVTSTGTNDLTNAHLVIGLHGTTTYGDQHDRMSVDGSTISAGASNSAGISHTSNALEFGNSINNAAVGIQCRNAGDNQAACNYDGTISLVATYSSPLTQTQIDNIWNGGSIVAASSFPSTNRTHLWTFDEKTGDWIDSDASVHCVAAGTPNPLHYQLGDLAAGPSSTATLPVVTAQDGSGNDVTRIDFGDPADTVGGAMVFHADRFDWKASGVRTLIGDISGVEAQALYLNSSLGTTVNASDPRVYAGLCGTGLSCSISSNSQTFNLSTTLLNGAGTTDTAAGTVVRGDVIVGNSTPKWARLAKGSSGNFLGSDGTDSKFMQIDDTTVALSDNTNGNASTSKHGFAPKGDGVTTNCWNGAWAETACGSGGGTTNYYGSAVAVACTVSSATITCNLPSGYADAEIRWKGSQDSVTQFSTLYLKFNSDATAANYDTSQFMQTVNSSISGGGTASTTSGGNIGSLGGNNGTSVISAGMIWIPGYSDTTLRKVADAITGGSFATSTGRYVQVHEVAWASASAITTAVLTTNAGNWKSGTTATAYMYGGTAGALVGIGGVNGSQQTQVENHESLTLSGASTDTTNNILAAPGITEIVNYRITTTITGTGVTGFQIGTSGTATQFCGTQSTLTSGTTGTCLAHIGTTSQQQASAAKVRVTAVGGNFSGGVIELQVFSKTSTPPTS